MLYNYFTEKSLGLQGVLIENIEEIDDTIHIYCKLEQKIHKCPVCGDHTDKIHDYREQIIKDIPTFGKFVFIHLKKRRYSCSCGKRFYEKNSFLPRFHRMTNRLVAYVIDKLRYDNPKENWVIFKDVHEPIISRDDFELVQTLVVKTKRRAPKKVNGEKNMFCDFIYCADCGSKLWYHTNTNNKEIRFFSCSNYKKDTRGNCESHHYIRADAMNR